MQSSRDVGTQECTVVEVRARSREASGMSGENCIASHRSHQKAHKVGAVNCQTEYLIRAPTVLLYTAIVAVSQLFI
jgi:uncharacterized low-complexity protein